MDNTSAAMINKEGDRGLPFFDPCDDVKNPLLDPLITIEY